MTEKHITNCGSLLVQQIYTSLVETSRQEGGELKIRMNFTLDEFANFTKIDTFQSMLTVSRRKEYKIRYMFTKLCTNRRKVWKRRGTEHNG